MEESMESEISAERNPFDRLPAELIVFIFDKISDAKCLCICGLVSKSFAAFVLRTRVLFVTMPGEIEACSCHPDPSVVASPPQVWLCRVMSCFLGNTPGFVHRPLLFMLSTLLKFLLRLMKKTDVRSSGDVIDFVKKFSCLESITIHSSFRHADADAANSQSRFEPLLRWKFGSSGFIFFSAKNRYALKDEYTDLVSTMDRNAAIEPNLTMEELLIQYMFMRNHFCDSMSRVAHIQDIAAVLPNINHAATFDDMKQGIVDFDEDDIAVVKEENPWWKADDKVYMKIWKAPAVLLPLSRCVMTDVSLILLMPTEGCQALLAENSFEEAEYRELATNLVKEEASFGLKFPISVLSG
ncbi:uncharacterized protein [Henckelia pumila]|uniref:uncharacterized protein n=1 Tax=Henckelia pumila TaxID=405737 RepID=UPI003C6E1A09